MNINEIVSGCDEGIRDVVRVLLELGFPCTDSGNGVSKGENGLQFPHVAVVFESETDVWMGMQHLREVLENHPEWPVNRVEAVEPCQDDLTDDELDGLGVAAGEGAEVKPVFVVMLLGDTK